MANGGTPQERRALGAAYASGVQLLLAPSISTRGVAAAPRPSRRADRLLTKSKALKNAAAESLVSSPDPAERAAAEVQLLAGAALDLAVASQLAGAGLPAPRGFGAGPGGLAELQALVAAPEAYLAGAVAGRGVRSLEAARSDLAAAVARALADIRADIVTTGGHVVEGLFLMDAALLREALGVVGGQLADKLGLDVKGLSRRVVEFVLAANDKIIAMLGVSALAEAQKQLKAWLEQLQAGDLFPELTDRVLQIGAIQAEVDGWLAAYSGDEAALLLGRDEVTALAGRFSAKADVADRLVSALALAKLAPPLLTPAGRLAVAAAYLGLLAYVIGSGYDHVDSDRIKLLDWTEGVRGVAKRLLTG
jgi:hypothetical protein